MRDTNDLIKIFRRTRHKIYEFFHRIMTKYKFTNSTPTTSHRHFVYVRAYLTNLLRNAKRRHVNFYIRCTLECLVLSRLKIIKYECHAAFLAIVSTITRTLVSHMFSLSSLVDEIRVI